MTSSSSKQAALPDCVTRECWIRTGAHAMLVFLALNGIDLQHSQMELSDVILQLAAGEIETSNLLHWILTHQI